MIIRIKSGALIGLNATDIDIEIDASQGLPGETIVGLPDKVIKESKTVLKRLSRIVVLNIHSNPIRLI